MGDYALHGRAVPETTLRPAQEKDRTTHPSHADAKLTEVVCIVKGRSRTETEIPLHLLSHAVARKVREWGSVVYRISVKRTHLHHYNVTVRTKTIRKELTPVEVAMCSCDPPVGVVKPLRKSKPGSGA